MYLAGVVLLGTLAYTLAAPRGTVDEEGKCPAFNYCEGSYFPTKFQTGGRTVMCDQAPLLRDNCCLPYSEHLVCYNIRVDGQFLNFNPENYLRSTDFTDLCKGMVTAVGREPGTSTSASHADEGGFLIWRYGHWSLNNDKGQEHVKHIACSVKAQENKGRKRG